jgi:hypothetical protein
MSEERSVAAAAALMRLGVSRAGVVDLLSHHPLEIIERQLRFLPLRDAKRPEALIVDAIRNDYSAPNPHRHAKDSAHASRKPPSMDEGPELPHRRPDAAA